MQIIIPMSGRGQRFLDAGYTDPKPLIEVGGMPIIEHVVRMFPGEQDFTFICAEDHLKTTPMESILRRIAPNCRIIPIKPHKKGPVYAVSLAYEHIDDEDEVVVNYCDFGKDWDWASFLEDMHHSEADGGIPAYRGFHPHMLGPTNYAFIRDQKEILEEIREKQPFTDNRMQEYASDGTYYFRSGRILKTYFSRLMERGIHTKDEYYVSMVYNLLLEDGLKVKVHPVRHMLQWGTPEDLQEFEYWFQVFENMSESPCPAQETSPGVRLLPMAGAGSRFVQQGFTTPKLLIPVSGAPMLQQALNSMVGTKDVVLVCRKEHEEALKTLPPKVFHAQKVQTVAVRQLTEGQACSCLLGLEQIEDSSPVFIGACDHGMIWETSDFTKKVQSGAEVIAFSFTGHPATKQKPQSWGYLITQENGRVDGVSVKVPISDQPQRDPAITGAFWFRSKELFTRIHQKQIDENLRVNGEFYVDTMIGLAAQMGHKVYHLPVKSYLGWGIPEDWRTWLYWQSFFHRSSWHPYTVYKDWMIANPEEMARILEDHQKEPWNDTY